MRRVGRRAAALALVAVAGCGGANSGADATPSASVTTSPGAASSTPTATPVSPQDQAACALLYTRLQRVTLALTSSSELIAQSVDQNDLSGRIATEREQLERSARLLAAGTVPPALAATNRRLIAALRDFAADFARAQAPAKRGDLPAAVKAMTDKAVVNRILDAATAIEDACHP